MSDKAKDMQTYLIVKSCVLQNTELSPLDKLVLSQIDYLDKIGEERGCWMSNSNIAKFLGVSASYVSTIVQKLELMGLISYEKEGRRRILISNIDSHSKSISNGMDTECQSISNGIDTECQSISNGIDTECASIDIECQSINPEIPEESIKNVIPKTIVNNTKNNNVDNKENNVVDKKSTTTKSSKTNSKKKQSKSSKKKEEWELLAEDMFAAILQLYPDYNKNHFKKDSKNVDLLIKKWAKQFKRLFEKFGRDYEEAVKIVEYVYSSTKLVFYQFSAKKIVDRYDELLVMMANNSHRARRILEPLPENPDQQFTKFVIQAWKRRIPMMDKDAFPNHNQMKHFINFTIKVTTKYDIPDDRIRNSMAKELIDILIHYKEDEAWRVRGGVLEPWMLASDHFWNEYFPQWYRNAGLPLECLTHFRNENALKEMVAEEEQLTEDIEKNLEKQSGKSKVISDDDIPELDYLKNV